MKLRLKTKPQQSYGALAILPRWGAAVLSPLRKKELRLVLYVFGGLAFGPGVVGVGED